MTHDTKGFTLNFIADQEIYFIKKDYPACKMEITDDFPFKVNKIISLSRNTAKLFIIKHIFDVQIPLLQGTPYDAIINVLMYYHIPYKVYHYNDKAEQWLLDDEHFTKESIQAIRDDTDKKLKEVLDKDKDIHSCTKPQLTLDYVKDQQLIFKEQGLLKNNRVIHKLVIPDSYSFKFDYHMYLLGKRVFLFKTNNVPYHVLPFTEGVTFNKAMKLLDDIGIPYTYEVEYASKSGKFYFDQDMLNKQINKLKDSHSKNISTFYKNLEKLIQDKNAKYGGSATNPLNIFPSEDHMGSRINEKLSRIKFTTGKGEKPNKNDVVDLVGVVSLYCINRGWIEFEDIKN